MLICQKWRVKRKSLWHDLQASSFEDETNYSAIYGGWHIWGGVSMLDMLNDYGIIKRHD